VLASTDLETAQSLLSQAYLPSTFTSPVRAPSLDVRLNVIKIGRDQKSHLRVEDDSVSRMHAVIEAKPEEIQIIDLGSGKGRTLLMASEYPFRRILGVELLPSLHEIALENLKKYSSQTQRCFAIESLCEDARCFQFPPEPAVVYLFNPLPEEGLATAMRNLESSLREHPREVYVLYQNPVLRHVLDSTASLRYVASAQYYLLYKSNCT